jgi:hypothetical protein
VRLTTPDNFRIGAQREFFKKIGDKPPLRLWPVTTRQRTWVQDRAEGDFDPGSVETHVLTQPRPIPGSAPNSRYPRNAARRASRLSGGKSLSISFTQRRNRAGFSRSNCCRNGSVQTIGVAWKRRISSTRANPVLSDPPRPVIRPRLTLRPLAKRNWRRGYEKRT